MIKEDKPMKDNYIYVPGLSESVADEVKKAKEAEGQPSFDNHINYSWSLFGNFDRSGSIHL